MSHPLKIFISSSNFFDWKLVNHFGSHKRMCWQLGKENVPFLVALKAKYTSTHQFRVLLNNFLPQFCKY
jgi:hypothetical protein